MGRCSGCCRFGHREEKVKNFKKKTKAESHPHGHSFEAVGHLRSRLMAKDFVIFSDF